MQPKHVEYSRTIISVYVIFELASGASVTAIGSWHGQLPTPKGAGLQKP